MMARIHLFNAVAFAAIAIGILVAAAFTPTPWLFGGGAVALSAKSVQSVLVARRRGTSEDSASTLPISILLGIATILFLVSWAIGEGRVAIIGAAAAIALAVMFFVASGDSRALHDDQSRSAG
jgi:hypothetical protein